MDSFYGTHSAEQAQRHTMLVLRKLGIKAQKRDIATMLYLDCCDYADKNGQGPVPIEVLIGLTTSRYAEVLDYLDSALNAGIYIFFEQYVMHRAAKYSAEGSDDFDTASAKARELCDLWYEKTGMPREDIGLIVADPRFDRIAKIEGRSQQVRSIAESYLRRRNFHLALANDLPNWHVVRSGRETLPLNATGMPCYYEDIIGDGLWRPYDDIELEVIRRLLPENITVSDEHLRELLESVQFQNL
jgi:hypothetical protein